MKGSRTRSRTAFSAWVRKRIWTSGAPGISTTIAATSDDGAEAEVEDARLGEAVVEVGAAAEGLGDRVGGGERHDRRREQRRAEQAEAEERGGEAAGQRLERAGRVAGVVDLDPAGVQSRGAGDDDEEADHAGEDGADDDVDPLEAQVLDAAAACRPRRTG